MSRFAFLQREWPDAFAAAAQAEAAAHRDPRAACFHARRALELAVKWAFRADKALKTPYQDNIRQGRFPRVIPLWRCAGCSNPPSGSRAATAASRVPHPASPSIPRGCRGEAALPRQTLEQLRKLQEEIAARDAQLAAALADRAAEPDTHDYSEAETRAYLIDLLLKEVGWTLDQPAWLGKRLFATRLAVIAALDEKIGPGVGERSPPGEGDPRTEPELRAAVAATLHGEIAAMNFDNFVVRPKRQIVEKYRGIETWDRLMPEAREELIDKASRKPVDSDFEDALGGESEIALPAFASAESFDRFRAKARAFMRANQDHVAVHKLRMNRPLTAADLAEHGVMPPAAFYESPFTALTPTGPEALFSAAEIEALVDALERIDATAAA